MDPSTLQIAEVTSPIYWRTPFDSLATVSDLIEFVVLDIEPSGQTRGKYVLADAQVAPAKAFQSGGAPAGGDMDIDGSTGGSDAIYHTRTHLGGVLQPGDTVLGYYLSRNNFNSDAFEQLDPGRVPDVILVKKTYPSRRKKPRARNWKLKSIAKEAEEIEDGVKGAGRGALGRRGGLDRARVEADYETFLRDLEEDPELRSTVNLYRADTNMAGPTIKRGGRGKAAFAMDVDSTSLAKILSAPEENEEDEDVEPDFPEIKVDELLEVFDDLAIRDDSSPDVV